MNTQPLLDLLRSRLPDLMAVYLFGSQAKGTAGPESDIDLAVLMRGQADPLLLWELAGDLSDLSGLPVDLVDFRAASTVMQYQILTQGMRLWGDDVQVGVFESFVLSEKMALDIARAGLMDDIQKQGSVYGR